MQKLMKRLGKYIKRSDEELYLIACEVMKETPMAPVPGYEGWPITYFKDMGEEDDIVVEQY